MSKDIKPKCPFCKSQEIRSRVSTKEFVCRRCGMVWKKGQEATITKKALECFKK